MQLRLVVRGLGADATPPARALEKVFFALVLSLPRRAIHLPRYLFFRTALGLCQCDRFLALSGLPKVQVASIARIVGDRKANELEMQTDLMRAAGDGLAREQRGLVIHTDDADDGLRFLAILVALPNGVTR